MPAKIFELLDPPSTDYVDRRFKGTKEEYYERLGASSTLYVGNMSFYTSEDQVYALFSRAGHVARVIMGLDATRKTPCGFCFVIYDRREDALAAARYLNGTSLDERPIRVDIDYGFEEGRQFGRGRSGGQVRDEFRTDYDSARGGFGKQLVKQIASQGLAVKEMDGGQVAFVPVPQAWQAGGGGEEGGGGGGGGEGEPSAKRQRVEGGGSGGGEGAEAEAEAEAGAKPEAEAEAEAEAGAEAAAGEGEEPQGEEPEGEERREEEAMEEGGGGDDGAD
ncbi:hypothetical protein Rsub_06780 [Raphidocelis subcapitata]|uniref:Nuclear cap-binding protein subunit 2 n=1 Tax=Raphidocelis subcapitata TaxID=307507 RepID=A0A2V0P939_9CHLO|nr:hypothetical protein Rsub_06780 [Raphidocelis subcapitata]|eukprot:GBF93677.1 hypothetical protein Rsub_06780 [Raphidocelis subcapitata]